MLQSCHKDGLDRGAANAALRRRPTSTRRVHTEGNECQVFLQDCRVGLKDIPSDSIDIVITDPPYFIDGMGGDWDRDNIDAKKTKSRAVGGLPVGMKFDPEQGRKFQAFMSEIAGECFRVLKPGAFFISFSQARLYHRLGVAAEDAGFEVRDMLGWIYRGQAKAFSQDHFVRRMKIPEAEKRRILLSLDGRKTPQLAPMIEPMVLGQKPRDGTFVDNWLKHGVGLLDTTQSLDGLFPGNLMDVRKPHSAKKKDANSHPTVKPVELIAHLIKLFSKPGDIVLDPFMGSGTTAVAAINAGRRAIGFERETSYFEIIKRRVLEADNAYGGAS